MFNKNLEEKAAVPDINTLSHSVIGSPLNGNLVALGEVPDQVFSSGMLGFGVAILPSEGKLVAPCNGKISVAFPTGHAIGLVSDTGVELLMHIGLDTVELEGKYFDVQVKVGDTVKSGETMVQFDIEKIKDSGYNTITPVIVTNTADYTDIEIINSKVVEIGMKIIEINSN